VSDDGRQGLVEPVENALAEKQGGAGFVVLSAAFRVGKEQIRLWRRDRVVERFGIPAADVVFGFDDQSRASGSANPLMV
jgi:hypothetical protein